MSTTLKIILLRTYFAGLAFFFAVFAFGGDLLEVIIFLMLINLLIRSQVEQMIKYGNKNKGLISKIKASNSYLSSLLLMFLYIFIHLIEATILVILIRLIHIFIYNYIFEFALEPYSFAVLYGLLSFGVLYFEKSLLERLRRG